MSIWSLNPPVVSLVNVYIILKATSSWETSLIFRYHLKPRQNRGLSPQVSWACSLDCKFSCHLESSSS